MFIKTDWQTSLPKTGDNSVSVLVSNGYLYTGSNGFVYKLDPALGSIVAKNGLPDRGNHDVRFAIATDGRTLYVGTDGYALALDSGKLTTKWQTSLPDTGDSIVNLVFHDGALYAGSNGFVYKLDESGKITKKNTLPDRGNHQVKLALAADQQCLYVGTDGYAISLSSEDLETQWQTSLPETGDNDVKVLYWNGFVYAGSNGFVYKLDASGKITQKNTLPDRGRHKVSLAMSSSGTELFVGTDGYALGLLPDTLKTVWQTSLPDTGDNDVNLLSSDLYLYAGSDGRVFELNAATGEIVAKNSLPDRGDHEVRIAIAPDQAHLYIGTDGYAIGTSEFGAESVDLSRWMEKLGDKIKSKKLRQVCLPGTHDSATYGIDSDSEISPDGPDWAKELEDLHLGFVFKFVFANWAKAQGDDIKEQLRGGIRYLDLRVCRRSSDDDLWICHGMYSVNIDEVIKAVKDFLTDHPKEIVLLDFNHFYEMNSASHAALVEKLKNAFDSLFAPASVGTDVTVSALWESGKQVIVFYDDDEVVQNHPELWPQSTIDSPWPNVTSVSDLYDKLEDELPNDRSEFFVLQGILTPNGSVISAGLVPFSDAPDSLLSQADEVNPSVDTWVRDQWNNDGLNIVIVDWYERSSLVNILLLINGQDSVRSRSEERTAPLVPSRPRRIDLETGLRTGVFGEADVRAKAVGAQIRINPHRTKELSQQLASS